MSKHHIVYYGNTTLHTAAQEITDIDQGVVDLIESMYNIMYRERGVGLAAPQIDVSRRLIILDIEHYKGPSLALINPRVVKTSEDLEPYEEGCLSLPGINLDILRPGEVTVKGVTPDGKEISIDADGLLARVLQHEIDHLDGKVIVDHVEDHIRKELTAELKKIKKLNRAS